MSNNSKAKTAFKARKAGKPVVKEEGSDDKSLRSVVTKKGFKSYAGNGLPVFKKGPNDTSWRTGNKLSTALAANLPFNNPNGITIDVSRANSLQNIITPGIMRIAVLATCGVATDYNSPVNLAARRCYSLTRKANSGSKNYESADQMLYFLSMEQAYALCGWLQRLYRTITKFSALDRYQPRTLVSAMEVDYDDIKQHQAELAWLIRWMGSSLNSLAVPKFPVFTAAYDLFRHIYVDDSSPRHQIYMFDAYNFGQYNPTFSATGGGVDFDNGVSKISSWSAGNVLTYSEIYTMVHGIMDPLLGDEDVAIIAGDILKAYDESELFKVESDSMDSIELEYSEEILQQIHNIRTLPTGIGVLTAYEQDPGSSNTAPFIKSTLTFSSPAAGSAMPRLYDIDAFSDQPSPEEIVNCTAAQCRIEWIKTTLNPATINVTKVTFDLILPIKVETFIGTTLNTALYDISLYVSDAYTAASTAVSMDVLRSWNFDWSPFSYVITGNIPNDGIIAPLGDVRMLSYFNFSVHERIHENSVLNLFSLLDN